MNLYPKDTEDTIHRRMEGMTIDAPLDWADIRMRAADFVREYKDATSEESDKQDFWSDFFRIFGLTARHYGWYEKHVTKGDDSLGKIDYFWPGKLIIEHKSRGKDLNDAFVQAVEYMANLKRNEYPQYIIVSDFEQIWLYDAKDVSTPHKIKLVDLVDNIGMFEFIPNYNQVSITGQNPVNQKAAEMMGQLYDMLLESGYPRDSVDQYLVRIVFCLFAEDSGLFPKTNQFSLYIRDQSSEDGGDTGSIIDSIFNVLDIPEADRQKNMADRLKAFPYVNGGLFRERLPIAYFNREMKDLILECAKLNWKSISPAIFGSMFQSVMDEQTRHDVGAHYTSEENIMKLINPLFMDDLRAEFQSIRNNKMALEEFAKKLGRIKVLDPACGCGNFLIVTYRELKKLEMDVLQALYQDKAVYRASRVTIENFYGIELLKFPMQIAQVSMWLMEHLMSLSRMERFQIYDSIIPLKKTATIFRGNSITKDWSELVDPSELTYIIGNPPYIGARVMDAEAKDPTADSDPKKDMEIVFGKNAGSLDYVAAWFMKAAKMMSLNPEIRTAFVSTNSICQGEQVAPLWRTLMNRGIKINFAYKTFKWSNEARGNAAVFVIIVGFSYKETPNTALYTHSEGLKGNVVHHKANHINAYLIDAPDIFLENRKSPICDVPPMILGNQPVDGGNFIFTKEEMDEFVRNEPGSVRFFRKWMGSKDFINDAPRYCLWLKDCQPSEMREMPLVMERVSNVREFRAASKRAQTRKFANMPTRFYAEVVSNGPYLLMPRVSSENREYIPTGFVQPDTLSSDSNMIMNDCTPFHFGVITSKMHMTWMRYVCGRLKSDYRYSAGIVYNNFPWPKASVEQVRDIEDKAGKVLEARELYKGQSFADLYDPDAMPIELRNAHRELDKAVDRAYRKEPFKDDNDRMAFLFDEYAKIVLGTISTLF